MRIEAMLQFKFSSKGNKKINNWKSLNSKKWKMKLESREKQQKLKSLMPIELS